MSDIWLHGPLFQNQAQGHHLYKCIQGVHLTWPQQLLVISVIYVPGSLAILCQHGSTVVNMRESITFIGYINHRHVHFVLSMLQEVFTNKCDELVYLLLSDGVV